MEVLHLRSALFSSHRRYFRILNLRIIKWSSLLPFQVATFAVPDIHISGVIKGSSFQKQTVRQLTALCELKHFVAFKALKCRLQVMMCRIELRGISTTYSRVSFFPLSFYAVVGFFSSILSWLALRAPLLLFLNQVRQPPWFSSLNSFFLLSDLLKNLILYLKKDKQQ